MKFVITEIIKYMATLLIVGISMATMVVLMWITRQINDEIILEIVAYIVYTFIFLGFGFLIYKLKKFLFDNWQS